MEKRVLPHINFLNTSDTENLVIIKYWLRSTGTTDYGLRTRTRSRLFHMYIILIYSPGLKYSITFISMLLFLQLMLNYCLLFQ